MAAFLLTFGLDLNILGWQPFGTLRAFVPGFSQVRSVTRFAALGQMYLVLMATLALSRGQHRPSLRQVVLVSSVGLFAAVENLCVPVPLTPLPASPQTSWTAWLRDEPSSTVVAHVPFPAGVHVSDYEIEAWRLFAQIDHHKPVVNGYSGYFPQARTPDGYVIPTYVNFQLAMAEEFPSVPLLCSLSKGLGANVLVVDQDWLALHDHEMAKYQSFLHLAYNDADVQIYYLYAPTGVCQS